MDVNGILFLLRENNLITLDTFILDHFAVHYLHPAPMFSAAAAARETEIF